jgi:hypothetical protein
MMIPFFVSVYADVVPDLEFAALNQVLTDFGCFVTSDPCHLNEVDAGNACAIYDTSSGLQCDQSGHIVYWNPPGVESGFIATEIVCLLCARERQPLTEPFL